MIVDQVIFSLLTAKKSKKEKRKSLDVGVCIKSCNLEYLGHSLPCGGDICDSEKLTK